MATAYLLTLQPTFTQGLVIGQVSILLLLVVILKYLFLDPVSDQPYKSSSYQPRVIRDEENVKNIPSGAFQEGRARNAKVEPETNTGVESADWLNIFLHQVRI